MYYLHLEGNSSGPYSREQIEGMLKSNQVSPSTLMWQEGQAEWLPLGSLFPPGPLVPLIPPALPAKGWTPFMKGVGVTLAIIGGILLGLVLLVAGAFGAISHWGTGLDKSSKAYVDEVVPAIVKNWSQEELSKRESAEFKEVTSDEELTKLFALFKRLGPLVKYKGAKGEALLNYPKEVTARYLVRATFQNGEAEIQVTLIHRHGAWEIHGFRVHSSIFSEKAN